MKSLGWRRVDGEGSGEEAGEADADEVGDEDRGKGEKPDANAEIGMEG